MIELKEITKLFLMGQVEVSVLRGVNCSVARGEYAALLGPSGSGKSTLMNILGCLDNPSSGTYHLDGRDVSELNNKELAHVRNEKIGFVFQTFNLLPHASAVNNVALPLVYRGIGFTERQERAAKMLEEVGLGQRLDHKPNEMSGGQRQRVAIARALVGEPELILADEPTGNLDTSTGQEIIRLFEDLVAQGKTLIIVTHDLKLAQRTHRIINILDGKVVPND